MVALACTGLMAATLQAEPRITGVDAGASTVTVTLSGIDTPRPLVMAFGEADYGETLAAWPQQRLVGMLAKDQTTAVCELPGGWGDSVRTLRFFLLATDVQLDWLDADRCYVQTDIMVSGKTRVWTKMRVLDMTISTGLFCSRKANGTDGFALFTQVFTHGWKYDYGNKNATYTGLQPQGETPVVVDAKGPICVIDDVQVANYEGQQSWEALTPLALFAGYKIINTTTGAKEYASIGSLRFYGLKVWSDYADEQSLANDLVPYIDSKCRVCVRDTLTSKSYYAQGEGGFNAFSFRADTPTVACSRACAVPWRFLTSESYAQNEHLIAQWDAIDNAGRGIHSAAPSTWVDLIGNAQNIKASDALQYQPTAVYFPGSARNGTYSLSCNIPEIKTALSNKSCTVEMQLKVVEPLLWEEAYRSGGILQVGGSSVEDGLLHKELDVYQHDNRSAASHTTLCDTFGAFQYARTSTSSDFPPENNYYGQDVLMTVMVNGEGAHLSVDCEHLYSSAGEGVDPLFDFVRIGSWGVTTRDDPSNGSSRMYVRSIRVYDTSLTSEETQRNLLVDQCRFGMQVDAFEYGFEGGTLTLSGNFRTDLGFGYDVYALVLDVNGNGTVTTNRLGTIDQAQFASYSVSGLEPDGKYEVGLLLANAERGYANVVRNVFIPGVAEPEPIAWIGKTSDALPWDSTAGWVANNSGLHRLPIDGDTVSIGREAGDYTLNLTGAGALAVKGWSGAGYAGVTSKTTVGAGTALTVNGAMTFSENQSGSRSEFVVDGGNVQVDGSNVINLYGNDTLTVKDGSFHRAKSSREPTYHSVILNGSSRINIQGGEFTLDHNTTYYYYDTIRFTGAQSIVQTGGTATFSGFSPMTYADALYEISGGAVNSRPLYMNNGDISLTTSCLTIRPRGSKFDFTVQNGMIGNDDRPKREHPALFFDFRVRSDSAPGAKGVGFVDFGGGGNTVIYGMVRAVPDGGMAIVHTNRFPLMVQHIKKDLTFTSLKDNVPAHRFMPTGIFDIGIPADQKYMVRADLKPEAELTNGWTSEEGVSAGFVKLPRISNPAGLLKANLKLKVEPKGTKTLASIKSDLEAMGFGPVTVDESAAYNLVVGLPKDRLARDFPDSKVLIDFTEVTGVTAAQQNNVTTNALIKAVSLDIAKPGLVLFVM